MMAINFGLTKTAIKISEKFPNQFTTEQIPELNTKLPIFTDDKAVSLEVANTIKAQASPNIYRTRYSNFCKGIS